MTTLGPQPLVPSYMRNYLARYYDNMSSTIIENLTSKRVLNSYYLGVNLTPEQQLQIQQNFKNKSPPPIENFIGNLIHVSEKYFDNELISRKYYVIQFVYGYTNEYIIEPPSLIFPNVLSPNYITATYYNLTGVDFNPADYVNDSRSLVLPPDAVIDTNPDNVWACEINQILPNSINYGKLRAGTGSLPGIYPDGPAPQAIAFYREIDSDLTSSNGITPYNYALIPTVYNNFGLSKSVEHFIECLP